MRVLPPLFLLIILSGGHAGAETFYRCACLGSQGQVLCGASDFGTDPDGANVPGTPSPEENAEKMCRKLSGEREALSCQCTTN